MPVVRGDRIGMSDKLCRCSPDAQTAYAHFVATIPDDFGRFPLLWLPIVSRLYPRMDDRRAITRQLARWKRFFAEYEREGLLRTWEDDGMTLVEMSGWRPGGKRYHRTVEPPWSRHVHDKACARSAVSRLRASKRITEADELSCRFNKFQTTEQPPSTPAMGPPSSPPSPSSPTVHREGGGDAAVDAVENPPARGLDQGSNGRQPVTDETASELEAIATELHVACPSVPAQEWIARASRIEAGSRGPERAFHHAREPGVTESWARTTLRILRGLLREQTRPVPL